MDKNLEKQIDEILTRGVNEVIGRENLKKRLLSGEKLRIKLGIDPTSPNIHLGRAVTLLKLKDLQKLGHQIVFIIGDFTGQIGDTSDKESERPMLSEDLVKNNMKSYLDQAFKIIDKDETKIFHNSDWLSNLTLDKIGKMATWFSLAEFISRENIKKRLAEGKRVSLRELFYPLMQGYDSVRVVADVEIGGTDQRFNMLAGRELQRYPLDILDKNDYDIIKKQTGKSLKEVMDKKNEPQDIIMVNLIEGADGRKMSSSWGNTINITDEANEMFEKVMNISDELIVKYFIHCTRISMDEIEKIEKEIKYGKLNPRDAKLKLAFKITEFYHNEDSAKLAQNYFTGVEDLVVPSPAYEPEVSLVDYLIEAKMAKSKSDAKRKIEQGGVEINGKKEIDWKMVLKEELHDGAKIKVGKSGAVKIKF